MNGADAEARMIVLPAPAPTICTLRFSWMRSGTLPMS
jgi:hypothetical protein